MKKNLMSVLILALVLVNLILTGILTITILPQTKKSNELVNKVCSAIDLELESGDGTESASIPMDQVETYKIEDAMTINLKTTTPRRSPPSRRPGRSPTPPRGTSAATSTAGLTTCPHRGPPPAAEPFGLLPVPGPHPAGLAGGHHQGWPYRRLERPAYRRPPAGPGAGALTPRRNKSAKM